MNETVDGGTAPVSGQALDTMLDPGAGTILLDSSGVADRLLAFFAAGGPVVLILLACSVVALAIVLLKFWQFHAARLGDRRQAAEAVVLLRRGRSEEALALLARSRSPVAQVMAQAIQGRQRRELPEAVVREEVLRSGNEAIEGLRTHLSALEMIGSVAPLLGLFGDRKSTRLNSRH